MKILFPSETHTAANKNLPDFHQATWVWIRAICDCAALPDVLSSVPSLFNIRVNTFHTSDILIFVFPECMPLSRETLTHSS